MFKRIPASKKSLAMRKLVYGAGLNDADYITAQQIDGRTVLCPTYSKWKDMLKRAYSPTYQLKNPTYKGCTTCTEWLTFSNFARWYSENVIECYDLDKDLKIKGNKLYSPETCLFVPHAINSLLNDSAAARGPYPVGVCYDRSRGKLKVQISIDGKRRTLGRFTTKEAASKVYIKAKNAEMKRKCEQYPEFAQYLLQHLHTIPL